MEEKKSSPYHMIEFQKVESVDEKINLFPFLKNIESEKGLEEIAQIIDKLSIAKYESDDKYSIIWDVLKLGTLLFRELPEHVTDKVQLKELDNIDSTVDKCSSLTDRQQWRMFKSARDISADFCHLIYEEKAELFVSQVIKLCKGEYVKDALSNINREFAKVTRGGKRGFVPKYYKKDDERKIKMFEQAGYFIERAKTFLTDGNISATCMAIMASGDCCRSLLTGKITEDKTSLTCVKELSTMRNNLSHLWEEITENKAEKDLLIEILPSDPGKFNQFIVGLTKDAAGIGLEIDVKGYIGREKPTKDDVSPRGYNRNVFK